MSITWNPSNDLFHYRRHHVSFQEAATVFTDPNAVERDDKTHPGRKVLIGLTSIEPVRLLRVSFEEEVDTIIIISARKASPSNREEYSTSNHL